MRLHCCRGSLLAGFLMLVLAGCDSAPGPESVDQRAPVVTQLTFSPQVVSLENVNPDQISGDIVRVPVTLSVNVSSSGNPIQAVGFVVQSPISASLAVAEGQLQRVEGNVYETTATIEIPKAETGKYTVLVYAVDENGTLSNNVRGLINFVATGRPPEITLVEADPETLTPPAVLKLVATVSDPDGLANVSRVVVRTPNGHEFDMYDDGISLGDAVPGDGKYTARFDVPSATPGTQVFRFQAFDRAGFSSAVIEKGVVIQ